jgi:hypothetical protein
MRGAVLRGYPAWVEKTAWVCSRARDTSFSMPHMVSGEERLAMNARHLESGSGQTASCQHQVTERRVSELPGADGVCGSMQIVRGAISGCGRERMTAWECWNLR